MKNTFIVLFLALASVTAIKAQQKFGYVNSAQLMTDLEEVKKANQDLEAFQKQKASVLENMAKQLQDKAVALEQKRQQGTIAPKDYEAQMKNLEKEQNKILDLQKSSAAEVDKKRAELFDPILNRLNEAIKAVAKENGLNYIFDTSTGILLYADEALDMSEKVKAKYNELKAAGK